jgi:hypothetical protein
MFEGQPEVGLDDPLPGPFVRRCRPSGRFTAEAETANLWSISPSVDGSGRHFIPANIL